MGKEKEVEEGDLSAAVGDTTGSSNSEANDTDNNNDPSNGHMAAMAGWKARKEQLHRQQKSVDKANNEAEKVNLVSLSLKKKETPDG